MRTTLAEFVATSLVLLSFLLGNADTPGGTAPLVVERSGTFHADFLGTSAANIGGNVVLQDGELRSLDLFAAPLEVEFRVKSTGADIRFGTCGADQIVFEWATRPSELRIDGGPANGRHIDGKGRFPVGRFVTVKEIVTEDRLDILIDGEPRGTWFGDFRGRKAPIRVVACGHSTVEIESIHIAHSDPAGSRPPKSTLPPESGRFARNERFDDDFISVRGIARNEAIVVRDGIVASRNVHAVPLAIEYRVRTDVDNIRLGYGAHQIIFAWEVDPDTLRIELGPCGGQHVPKMGRIPPGEFVTIRQVVREDSMELLVDGAPRASWKGDFRGYAAPVCVFTVGSTLTVESIHIESLAK